jgi:hypothetical protein
MYQIQNITSDAFQQQQLILPDSSIITFQMYFVPRQLGWFITNLTYLNFQLTGMRICNSPNLLNQFRNQIPFGLNCISTQDREPTQQADFESGASLLFILTAAEVQEYVTYLTTGVS